ncbi:MAG: mechanosensitive ion channel [Planctomycetes bacterium]|nr:mechanosensitive ion channel [Planctomycetota bacterium]
MSQQLATVLRRYREQLPNIRELRQKLVEAQQELKDAESKTIVLDDTREAAKELDAELNARMLQVEPGLPKKTREAIRAEVTELLKSRKKYIQDLWTDYNNYLEQLGGTDGLVDSLQARLDTTESFAAFINEHIFWAKSTTLPNVDDKKHLIAAFRWLTSPSHWAAVGKTLIESAKLHIFEAALAGLFLLAVVLVQPRVRSSLRSKGATVSKSYAAVFAPTVEAFLLTLFAAITLPLFFWTMGWLISLQYGADEFVRAVERALQVLVIPVFSIELLRQTCRPQGLGEAHYNWPTKIVRLINRSCWLLIVIGVPLGVVAIMIDWKSNEHWHRSLGRLAFCLGQCLMSFVLWRVLRPKTGVLAEIPLIQKGGWQAQFGKFAFAVMVIAPLILMVISIFGYHYTAVEIASRFNRTLWLLFGLIILYGLGLRWLLVSRRKLAIEQARQRRAAQEAKQLAEAEKDGADASAEGKAESRVAEAPPEPEIDISSLNEQTRAILRALTIIGFVIVFWTVWADVIPALRIFDDVQLWSAKVTYSDTIAGPDGQPRIETSERMEWITLTDLFASILYLLAAVISIRNLPGLLEIGIYRRMSLGAGERYALTTILKYVITILGVLFAFGAIGIGWAQVQWLAAAMTVGLGFGLQEIFANFVSGLILLFERPIRVGDIVTVGGVDGRVTRIQMRATTILNWERKELIVPNKEFVTGQVMNWTLTDEVQRILIQVGVAYGSDTRKVKDLLTKVVTSHVKIIKDPAHRILFKGFGASTLDFEVVAFVEKSDDLVPTRDDLYYAIDDAFREASIEIAFPQLDIHVRNVPKELHSAAPATRGESAK